MGEEAAAFIRACEATMPSWNKGNSSQTIETSLMSA
jgi:hypothetical protein